MAACLMHRGVKRVEGQEGSAAFQSTASIVYIGCVTETGTFQASNPVDKDGIYLVNTISPYAKELSQNAGEKQVICQ